jgi:protein-S-isoprenylcysteine O-methyltransferase Ste14
LTGQPPRYWFPKPYADLVARLRVTFGFILAATFAWISRPTVRSLGIGIPISIVGILLRAWAAGHLAKNKRLATSGPYAYTRNPLYLGTLLVGAGLAAASRSWILAVVFAAVFGLIYLPAIELEEQHLRQLFPEYAHYAKSVPRLRPRFQSAAETTRFQFSLYLRNREYQALAGYLAGIAFLIWKSTW